MASNIFFDRHSKRAFLDKEVPYEKLERLFEIIRWTPSCANNQPWRFIFVIEDETKKHLMEVLAKGNAWAAKAPVLVVVCGQPIDDYNRSDDPITYYQFDCGLATMSLLLGAVDEGLMAHPMAGYHADGVKKILAIPTEYHVMCVVALGYEGFPEQLDYDTRDKDRAPRTRKEVDDIISIDRFQF